MLALTVAVAAALPEVVCLHASVVTGVVWKAAWTDV